MMTLAFIIMIGGVLLMLASDKVETEDGSGNVGVVVGGVMALIGLCGVNVIHDVQKEAVDALKASDEFAIVVAANPECKVSANGKGTEIVVSCKVAK